MEGASRRGTRQLPLDDLFDTFGKAVAAIAGLAAFVYVIGGLTVLARLQRLELPAESVFRRYPASASRSSASPSSCGRWSSAARSQRSRWC